MAKLKVVIGKPAPSKEVINRYKYRSSNQLMKDYQRLYSFSGIKRLFYKDKLLLYVVTVVLIILCYLIWVE